MIDVLEMRLYDFTRGTPPELFAIAMAMRRYPSLYGKFKMGPKRKDPPARTSLSIRAEKPELLAMVPAGEEIPRNRG